MVVDKKQFRSFCFYCKHEILNYDKSNKHVKYNGKFKRVCKNCNQNRHKTLMKCYKENDVQCKICLKPVMNKKCISCSICDNFYHGKCVNLNKAEINKIETICKFYLCPNCNKQNFPMISEPVDENVEKVSNINVSKQCLTCTNSIPKMYYYNKNIVYNSKPEHLCETCGPLELNTPVRDINLIEFMNCTICKRYVKYEAVFCNKCQHWIHPHCNGINKKELTSLQECTSNWYCMSCNLDIFPSHLLKSSNKSTRHDKSIIWQQKECMNYDEYRTYTNCSVCSKKVSGVQTLCCSTCNHWIHKNCIGYFKNRAEYQDFLTFYSDKTWDCPVCLSNMLPFIFLDNEEFIMLLLDIYSAPTYINRDNYKKVYKNLQDSEFFQISTDECKNEHNRYLMNIDPDVNFMIEDTCNYTINTEDIIIKSSKELTMMTFNIRSIKKNFKNFTNLLSRIQCKLHVICLTESWLGELDNIEDFKLDGYHKPLYQNRLGYMHGGGVITYIHTDITKHKYSKNLSFVDQFNHCLATEVTINNKNTTFLNVYRSPNGLNNTFPDQFESIIEKANSSICYVLGDFNYNLLNIDKHVPTEDYYNMLISSSFKPLILKPTRITETNKTLIDHIWTNDLRNTSVMKSHIIITDITDHLPCVTTVTSPDLLIKGYREITRRIINDENRQTFNHRISESKDILAFHVKNRHTTNIENKYDDYFDHISRIYNECFPLVTKKIHVKTLSKPWITPAVQGLIDKKNIRFSKKTRNNSDENILKYKKAKKIMEEEIDKEKDKYYKTIMDNTSNNIKKKWDILREIINRKKIESSCIISDKVLGEHYANIAPKLAEMLPKMTPDDIPSSSTKTDKTTPKNKFQFRLVTEREIYETLLKLDPNKGPGIDELDIKSLKSIANIIAPHLQILFNLSMSEGIYPQYLKIAKCVPVYKGSPLDPLLPINYRPISILTAVNKAFERLLHNQITIYLEENNILPPFQYGYRKDHNTSQAILDFTNYISKARFNKLVTIAVFMDLSKAFDTVDKSLLKQKLIKLGFCEDSIMLITSYMSDRKFCMKNDNSYYNLTYGVPQGSILGPLLFIMYISDMTDITQNNKMIVYADDTTVFVSGRSLTEAMQKCNDILNRFYIYFTVNKLSINPSKTKYLIYKPIFRKSGMHKLLYNTTHTKVMLNDTVLEQVDKIQFLGVVLNNKLTWEDHKHHISKKICKSLGIIYKCKNLLSEPELIKMYKTFIQPYFLYAIEVWGHSIQSLTDTLIKLQSKVLRIIYSCKRSDDAWRNNDNEIKMVKDLYNMNIGTICLKHHLGSLPNGFANEVMPNLNVNQLGNKITRISLNQMYNYKKLTGNHDTSFKMSCIKIWNALPLDIKALPYTNRNNALKIFKKFVNIVTKI